MTFLSIIRRVPPSLRSAVATAAIFSAVLWMQHARSAWPFDAPAPTAAPTQPAAATGTSGNGPDRVPVEAAAVGTINVGLVTVTAEPLTQTIRAVATIVPDESRISHVHTRVAGWLEQLYVNTTGEMVHGGEPLAAIFSQELLSSQTEYLAARKNTAASGIMSAVVESGRTRLQVLGMTPAEIDAIETSGQPRRLVTVFAPRSGIVINRGVTAGTAVDPSTTLVSIADLSRVWVLAEVPEANIPAVRVGTTAQLDFPASGRAPFNARVDFIYPTLTERTRTLRVRLTAANPRGALRPGLYGNAIFEAGGPPVLTVPRDAVIDTGVQQHVFVAVADRFEPRPVTLGVQLADRVEVRSGLREGDQVVASGVFLLDSESRLRATGGGHQHGAPASDQQPSAPPSDLHSGHEQPAAPPANPHVGH